MYFLEYFTFFLFFPCCTSRSSRISSYINRLRESLQFSLIQYFPQKRFLLEKQIEQLFTKHWGSDTTKWTPSRNTNK